MQPTEYKAAQQRVALAQMRGGAGQSEWERKKNRIDNWYRARRRPLDQLYQGKVYRLAQQYPEALKPDPLAASSGGICPRMRADDAERRER